MKKIWSKAWKLVKTFPLVSYALVWLIKNVFLILSGITIWYESALGLLSIILFFPIMFVYAELDRLSFISSDQNLYRFEVDLLIIVLFLSLDLALILFRKQISLRHSNAKKVS